MYICVLKTTHLETISLDASFATERIPEHAIVSILASVIAVNNPFWPKTIIKCFLLPFSGSCIHPRYRENKRHNMTEVLSMKHASASSLATCSMICIFSCKGIGQNVEPAIASHQWFSSPQ